MSSLILVSKPSAVAAVLHLKFQYGACFFLVKGRQGFSSKRSAETSAGYHVELSSSKIHYSAALHNIHDTHAKLKVKIWHKEANQVQNSFPGFPDIIKHVKILVSKTGW